MSKTVNGTLVLDKEEQARRLTETSVAEGWPMPPAEKGLGDHPLWQEYLAELKAQREADIAESNRIADLELEN